MPPRPSVFREPAAVFGVFSPPSCKSYPQAIAAVVRKTGLALPGGWIGQGETPEAALLRKLRSELDPGIEATVGRKLYEAEVSGQLVRTYEVDITAGADKIAAWATPDELIESQASKPIGMYNLGVLISAGFPLAALSESAWIYALASGSLQRSVDAGAAYRELYFHERAAMELDPKWDTVLPSRLQRGPALAMGDTPQWTEALWEARRIKYYGPACLRLQTIVPEWITISDPDGGVADSTWEGLALIASPVGLPWWPQGRLGVSKLSRWDNTRGAWRE